MHSAARVASETIAADVDAGHEFARQMENLPRWASGLAIGVRQENGDGFTDSPLGRVRVRMVPRNGFRVLDHDVTLPAGSTVRDALRVTPAGVGSGPTFVLLRLPGTSDPAFEKDCAHVAGDLRASKQLPEGR